jgi:hypothetical protein
MHVAHIFDGIALASHLQPIFSLPHQRAVGYEALLRGIAPSGPLVAPFDLFGRRSSKARSPCSTARATPRTSPARPPACPTRPGSS